MIRTKYPTFTVLAYIGKSPNQVTAKDVSPNTWTFVGSLDANITEARIAAFKANALASFPFQGWLIR
jgi:hypothetical protein